MVSSMAYGMAERIDYDALTHTVADDGTKLRDLKGAMTRYGNSKLANIYFALELDRRLRERSINNVYCNSCHPGPSSPSPSHALSHPTQPNPRPHRIPLTSYALTHESRLGPELGPGRERTDAAPAGCAEDHPEHVQRREQHGAGRGQDAGVPGRQRIREGARRARRVLAALVVGAHEEVQGLSESRAQRLGQGPARVVSAVDV